MRRDAPMRAAEKISHLSRFVFRIPAQLTVGVTLKHLLGRFLLGASVDRALAGVSGF
jgi:hypothetical protein